jgi:uncharacterized protein (DUF427 family)
MEPTHKRVRVVVNDATIADSTRVLMVWEKPYYPTYYIPVGDIADGTLVSTDEQTRSPSRGPATVYDVVADGATRAGVARIHHESPDEALRDIVAFHWDAMDAWYEEDEQVYVHPHRRPSHKAPRPD